MATLIPVRWRAAAGRCVPDTLFGRLALLLVAAVIVSHVLALTLMFELRPTHPGHPSAPHPPTMDHADLARAEGAGAPRFAPPPGPPTDLWNAPPAFKLGLLLDIGVRLAALLAVAWWAARWLAQPMRRLAEAAQELGRDVHRAPLPEDGTIECRDASRVFNQMQARIRQQLAERDRFVAAVSHDLRTPLTRLRLRTESLGDAQLQRLFQRDIAEMDAMIGSTLDHLCGVAHAEALAMVDVQALVDSLVDDHVAMGHSVAAVGHAAPLRVQAVALRRCLDNLVGNAVRYAGSAEIALRDAPDALSIEVRDTGPGLPPEELARVMEPFYRVEASRNRNTGGVGLGLTIAGDIVRRHSGQLLVRNADGVGLLVVAVFPRSGC